MPRGQKLLALATTTRAPDADVVVKVHDGSDDQRWRTEPVPAAEGSLSIDRTDAPGARAVDLSAG